jgi:carbon monoxide dehydrogenase subunit G
VKLHQEFNVAQQPEALWTFFEQPEAVARCMPGVESVTVLDVDNVQVRATQSIGPMNATFDARVTVLERIPNVPIRFRATGRSVRGAVGNVRAENSVRLRLDGAGTTVVVDGDIILAGALGAVGQKVVAKQAGKVTAQFAENLQRALSGEAPPSAIVPTPRRAPAASDTNVSVAASDTDAKWCKVAAAMSTVSAALSLYAILTRPRKVRP